MYTQLFLTLVKKSCAYLINVFDI